MLSWASIVAAIVSGFGVVNYGALPWIGDLIAVVFLITMFVAVCAIEIANLDPEQLRQPDRNWLRSEGAEAMPECQNRQNQDNW